MGAAGGTAGAGMPAAPTSPGDGAGAPRTGAAALGAGRGVTDGDGAVPAGTGCNAAGGTGVSRERGDSRRTCRPVSLLCIGTWAVPGTAWSTVDGAFGSRGGWDRGESRGAGARVPLTPGDEGNGACTCTGGDANPGCGTVRAGAALGVAPSPRARDVGAPLGDVLGECPWPGRATGADEDGVPLRVAPAAGVPGTAAGIGRADPETAPGDVGSGRGARTCAEAPGGGLALPAPVRGEGRRSSITGGALAITGAEATSDAGTLTMFVATGFRPASTGAVTAESAPGTAKLA
jgi:hypothetical protein